MYHVDHGHIVCTYIFGQEVGCDEGGRPQCVRRGCRIASFMPRDGFSSSIRQAFSDAPTIMRNPSQVGMARHLLCASHRQRLRICEFCRLFSTARCYNQLANSCAAPMGSSQDLPVPPLVRCTRCGFIMTERVGCWFCRLM